MCLAHVPRGGKLTSGPELQADDAEGVCGSDTDTSMGLVPSRYKCRCLGATRRAPPILPSVLFRWVRVLHLPGSKARAQRQMWTTGSSSLALGLTFWLGRGWGAGHKQDLSYVRRTMQRAWECPGSRDRLTAGAWRARWIG